MSARLRVGLGSSSFQLTIPGRTVANHLFKRIEYKEPRYEPFMNRTPLDCEQVWADYNITGDELEQKKGWVERRDSGLGIWGLCSPCGMFCRGNVQYK